LDIHRKAAFFQKIFEKSEVIPHRLYERLQYLDEKADLREFKGLLPNKRSLKDDEDVLFREELVTV